MTDKQVVDILVAGKPRINPHYRQIIDKNKELKEYIENRYDDSLSNFETIYRIWHNIEKRPVCICGNELKFVPGYGFRESCSVSCSKKRRKDITIDCNDDIIKQEYSITGPRNKTQEKFLIEHGYKEYLENRYNDSESITETIYRIINGIEKKPKCAICGKPVRLISYEKGFDEVCSDSCKIRNEIKYEDINDEYLKSLSYTAAYKENFRASHIIKKYLQNKFGDEYRSYQEAMYLVRTGLEHIPTCPVCGKYLTYNKGLHEKTFNVKYTKFCSNECAAQNKRNKWRDRLIEQTGYNITLDNDNNFVFHNACDKHKEFTLTPLMAHNRCMENRINHMVICPICNPERNKETSIEYIIKNILDKNNISYEQHNRKLISPKELDFYLPEYNIAIECNGMYWHSEVKYKDVTVSKVDLCSEKNIKLLTLWEYDIIHNSDKIEDIILSAIGKNKKIYARKCVVKEIDSKTARNFIEKYHLQGYVNSSIKLGLYYNDELVEVMTFGKLRVIMRSKSNDGEYELYRLCTKSGYTVVGGGGKLLEYFKKHYEWTKIISYCQRDISDGNVYEKIGFTLDSMCKKSFFYYDYKEDKIISRFALRKSVVDDGSGRTADEIIKNMGYMKCISNGNLKYIMKNGEY